MSETHDLTDKEIKALQDAASTVKKFAKYISQVNTTNWHLRRNLEESIKAGDVTNAQKVNLSCYEGAEKLCGKWMEKIREKCKAKGCKCENEKHDTCPLYQEFVIIDWMRGVAHGSGFDWGFIFQYACVGRKWQMGFPMEEALKTECDGKRLNRIVHPLPRKGGNWYE